MPALRLAYIALFLIALVAVFTVWSEAAGQGHLDLLPWWVKLGLGAGAALACTRAAVAAVEGKRAWNAGTLRWVAVLLVLATLCGLSAYYAHVYLEDEGDEDQQDEEAEPAVAMAAAWHEQGLKPFICGGSRHD